MKLYKNAAGKQVLRISKKEWLQIGKQADWNPVTGVGMAPEKAPDLGAEWAANDEGASAERIIELLDKMMASDNPKSFIPLAKDVAERLQGDLRV